MVSNSSAMASEFSCLMFLANLFSGTVLLMQSTWSSIFMLWPLLSSMHGNSLQLSGHIRTKPRVWRGTSAVALVRGGRWGEYTSDGLAGLQLLLQLVIIIMAETRVPFLVPLPRAASVLWPRLMFAFCKWTLDALFLPWRAPTRPQPLNVEQVETPEWKLGSA